jgi:hypothetical protein
MRPKIARRCGCGAETSSPSGAEPSVGSTVCTKAMGIQVPVSGLMTTGGQCCSRGRRRRTPRSKSPSISPPYANPTRSAPASGRSEFMVRRPDMMPLAHISNRRTACYTGRADRRQPFYRRFTRADDGPGAMPWPGPPKDGSGRLGRNDQSLAEAAWAPAVSECRGRTHRAIVQTLKNRGRVRRPPDKGTGFVPTG